MDIEYWKKRALAAEKFIGESPCDPDIFPTQLEAYNIWLEIKSQEIENPLDTKYYNQEQIYPNNSIKD